MKISKAVNLFMDYHRLNSPKKYEPYLWGTAFQVW
jgi:hypothetical protein